LCHIAGLDADALLKWRRAAAIASADECIDVLAIIAGWTAFLHYTNGRFESMIDELRNAFELHRMNPAVGALTSRSRMVVALVLHTCRKTQEALHWYKDARGAALSVGDDVEIAALVHNMAWIRVYNHRNALLRGEAVASLEADISRVSSEAVQSYEELVGLASFPAMTPLLRAQNFMLSEDFSSALSILDEHAKNVRSQGLGRLEPNFNADRTYCLARLGKLDNAAEAIESITRSIDESVHVDDLAVLYSRLRDSARLMGLAALSSSFNDAAWRNWQAFDELISKLLGGINSVVHPDR
jgi:tetratricopeptide (TPR) repeat protein